VRTELVATFFAFVFVVWHNFLAFPSFKPTHRLFPN
jgi:hypothetical protein